MRKIRADLIGVVMAGGRVFEPGQDVPEGIEIHETLIEGGSTSGEAPRSNGSASKASESSKASSGAGNDKGTPAEAEDEDYSDLLGDAEETKSSAKAPARGGRKSASTKRS